MSDSMSLVAETTDIGNTGGSDREISESNLPLVLVSAYQDEQMRHKSQTLPHLPSHRFRYSVWHELSRTLINGDKLHAPRVRDGPSVKEEMFYKLRDENDRRIHHAFRGRDRKDHRDQTENWENAVKANLSYQELGHQYQKDNFMRVLRRLRRVEELNLMHDGLTDVSSVAFPLCVSLNLCENYLKSFKKLPKLLRIENLNLDDNVIENLQGIETLKNTLISLSLKRNPVSFTLNYRQWVFKKLPLLQCLDGMPRHAEDLEFEEEPKDPSQSSCVIS